MLAEVSSSDEEEVLGDDCGHDSVPWILAPMPRLVLTILTLIVKLTIGFYLIGIEGKMAPELGILEIKRINHGKKTFN